MKESEFMGMVFNNFFTFSGFIGMIFCKTSFFGKLFYICRFMGILFGNFSGFTGGTYKI